ncbi:MAG: hypothetical protein ABI411_19090, partial [Tahibacter sp.]
GKSLFTRSRRTASPPLNSSVWAGGFLMTLDEMRLDFINRRNGCLSLPITGCIVWSLAAIAGFYAPPAYANSILIICYFLLIPISIAIARIRGEQVRGGAENPLLRLAALCRLMVTLLWGIHLPLLFLAPELFPLSMAIGFGIHWIVFSWTVGHPVGLIHASLRTFLVIAAWFCFPNNRMSAVSIAVVIAYLISVAQLASLRRQGWPNNSLRDFPST